MKLWREFHIWRGTRKYYQAAHHATMADILTEQGDRIIAQHVKPPMPLFDYSDMEEQDHWMRGK
jgi:hypothetical protein